jgi:hypothetical protein
VLFGDFGIEFAFDPAHLGLPVCSEAYEPLSVHKLFTYLALRGPFLLVAGAVAGCLLPSTSRRFVLRYLFMDARRVYYMTRWIWEAMCRGEVPASWLVLHISSLPAVGGRESETM